MQTKHCRTPATLAIRWRQVGDPEAAREAARLVVANLLETRQPNPSSPPALAAGHSEGRELAQTAAPLSYRDIGIYLDEPTSRFDEQIGGALEEHNAGHGASQNGDARART